MKFNIGDNNKINKSIVGSNNEIEKEENRVLKIVLEVVIGIMVCLIVGFCMYKLGWNK